MQLAAKKPVMHAGRLIEPGGIFEATESMAHDLIRYKLAEEVTVEYLTRQAEEVARYLYLNPIWTRTST